jgi:hypothetical protein
MREGIAAQLAKSPSVQAAAAIAVAASSRSRATLVKAAGAEASSGGGAAAGNTAKQAGGTILSLLKTESVRPFDKERADTADQLLLIWLVTSGVAFNAIDSVFFFAWVAFITFNRYKPAGLSCL